MSRLRHNLILMYSFWAFSSTGAHAAPDPKPCENQLLADEAARYERDHTMAGHPFRYAPIVLSNPPKTQETPFAIDEFAFRALVKELLHLDIKSKQQMRAFLEEFHRKEEHDKGLFVEEVIQNAFFELDQDKGAGKNLKMIEIWDELSASNYAGVKKTLLARMENPDEEFIDGVLRTRKQFFTLTRKLKAFKSRNRYLGGLEYKVATYSLNRLPNRLRDYSIRKHFPEYRRSEMVELKKLVHGEDLKLKIEQILEAENNYWKKYSEVLRLQDRLDKRNFALESLEEEVILKTEELEQSYIHSSWENRLDRAVAFTTYRIHANLVAQKNGTTDINELIDKLKAFELNHTRKRLFDQLYPVLYVEEFSRIMGENAHLMSEEDFVAISSYVISRAEYLYTVTPNEAVYAIIREVAKARSWKFSARRKIKARFDLQNYSEAGRKSVSNFLNASWDKDPNQTLEQLAAEFSRLDALIEENDTAPLAELKLKLSEDKRKLASLLLAEEEKKASLARELQQIKFELEALAKATGR